MVHMDNNNSRRYLAWGTVRSESISGKQGEITLTGIDSGDLTVLAARVDEFLSDFQRRADMRDAELEGILLDDPWLLGYVFGACAACFTHHGLAGETTLLGFASRVCGELLGGGIKHKLAAFDNLSRITTHPDFHHGHDCAVRDWIERQRW